MSQNLEKMLLEEERLKELSEAKNSAEVKKVYKKSGLDITDEQAEQFIKVRDNINANPPKDTEAFLDEIAGGVTISNKTRTFNKNAKYIAKAVFELTGMMMLGTLAAGACLAGVAIGLPFAAKSGANAADKLFGK